MTPIVSEGQVASRRPQRFTVIWTELAAYGIGTAAPPASATTPLKAMPAGGGPRDPGQDEAPPGPPQGLHARLSTAPPPHPCGLPADRTACSDRGHHGHLQLRADRHIAGHAHNFWLHLPRSRQGALQEQLPPQAGLPGGEEPSQKPQNSKPLFGSGTRAELQATRDGLLVLLCWHLAVNGFLTGLYVDGWIALSTLTTWHNPGVVYGGISVLGSLRELGMGCRL